MLNDSVYRRYTQFCAVCGHALEPHEVGSNIHGELADYREHVWYSLNIDVCVECTNKMAECINGGIEEAIKKRAKLERLNKFGTE